MWLEHVRTDLAQATKLFSVHHALSKRLVRIAENAESRMIALELGMLIENLVISYYQRAVTPPAKTSYQAIVSDLLDASLIPEGIAAVS